VNRQDDPDSTENPFAAGRVRPGSVPFRFAEGQSAAELVRRLAESGWWGQIIGPHGSGKSTLLATLIPLIRQLGRAVVLFELHDGRRDLPVGWKTKESAATSKVVVVDGYEQVGRLSRWRVRRWCRRHGCGLLITAHAPVGLPDLFRTTATLDLARELVRALQDRRRLHVADEDVVQSFARHGDNLREMLFDLYDLYEQRRRQV